MDEDDARIRAIMTETLEKDLREHPEVLESRDPSVILRHLNRAMRDTILTDLREQCHFINLSLLPAGFDGEPPEEPEDPAKPKPPPPPHSAQRLRMRLQQKLEQRRRREQIKSSGV